MNIRQVTDGKEDYIELLRSWETRMNPESEKYAGRRRTLLTGRARKAPHTCAW